MALNLPGLSYPHTVTAVILRGPAPSRILGLAAHQPVVSTPYGQISFDVNGSSIVMQDAASVSYHLRQNMRRRGEPVLSVAYEDRRWKWRYATVSGLFNERLPDCSIRFNTKLDWKRSARGLFKFVLDACGETNADVMAAPDNVYPMCDWRDARCDVALDELCRLTYCTLILDYQTNRVSVARLRRGTPLPDSPTKTHVSTACRIAAIPDAIAIGCGPTRYQSKLSLEPVGLDTDGKIKKIDDLSYKPADGWSRSWPGEFSEVAFGKARALAARTVWRWYRVSGQASGGLNIPGTFFSVQDALQYQLTPWLVDCGEDYMGMRQPQPAYIQGSYYPQQDFEANSETKDFNPAPFTIIPELNVVEFAYPVWYASEGYEKPSLYLTTSYFIRKDDGGGYQHFTPRLQLGHAPVGTRDFVLPHRELWQTHVVRYTDDDLTPAYSDLNTSQITAETDEYLSRAEDAIASLYGQDKSYAGVLNDPLDGMRASEVIEYGQDILPTSRYSENVEHDIFTDDPHRRTL